jgi:hypothetical protein
MRSDVSRTMIWLRVAAGISPSSPFGLRRGSLRYRSARLAEAGEACEGWWSQTGSNRRPHACKARALPAELWPRNQKTNALRSPKFCQPVFALSGFAGHASLYSLRGCATRSRRRSVVGLGRLELPTSRLSSARSNQLSYKPLHEELMPRAIGKRRCLARRSPGACSSAKKEKRRRRNPANGAQQS